MDIVQTNGEEIEISQRYARPYTERGVEAD